MKNKCNWECVNTCIVMCILEKKITIFRGWKKTMSHNLAVMTMTNSIKKFQESFYVVEVGFIIPCYSLTFFIWMIHIVDTGTMFSSKYFFSLTECFFHNFFFASIIIIKKIWKKSYETKFTMFIIILNINEIFVVLMKNIYYKIRYIW